MKNGWTNSTQTMSALQMDMYFGVSMNELTRHELSISHCINQTAVQVHMSQALDKDHVCFLRTHETLCNCN